jgi:hypothetical protein
MSQASDSHLIASEARRLGTMPHRQALADLGDRIARTFQLIPPAGSPYEFNTELDFNARLVTFCRNEGVIWPQSR